jgi:hypothetical protein
MLTRLCRSLTDHGNALRCYAPTFAEKGIACWGREFSDILLRGLPQPIIVGLSCLLLLDFIVFALYAPNPEPQGCNALDLRHVFRKIICICSLTHFFIALDSALFLHLFYVFLIDDIHSLNPTCKINKRGYYSAYLRLQSNYFVFEYRVQCTHESVPRSLS